jgi:hypothetical protein
LKTVLSSFCPKRSNFDKPLTSLEENTYNFGKNDEGNFQDAVGTGNLSAKMKIEQKIPQFLPMMGQKFRLLPRNHINCYQQGHIKKIFKNPTGCWMDYN